MNVLNLKCQNALARKSVELANCRNELANLKISYNKVQRNFTQLLLANGDYMLKRAKGDPLKKSTRSKIKRNVTNCPKQLQKLEKELASLKLKKRTTRSGRTGNKIGYYKNLLK